jgi:ribosomal protein S17
MGFTILGLLIYKSIKQSRLYKGKNMQMEQNIEQQAPAIDTRPLSERKKVKANKEFIKLSDAIFTGFIVGNIEVKHSDSWNSDFITFDVRLENGDIGSIVLDGGLRGALKLSNILTGTILTENQGKTIVSHSLNFVKPNLAVEIEYTGKIEVENGEANSYKVFILE